MLWDHWHLPNLPLDPGKLRDFLAEHLDRLRRILDRQHQHFHFGPVPGAYFPLVFRYQGAFGDASPLMRLSVQHSQRFEAKPVWATGITQTDNTSVQITYDVSLPKPIMSTPLAVTPAGAFYDRASQFLKGGKISIAGGTVLSLNTTATGASAEDLSVLLVLKAISQLDRP